MIIKCIYFIKYKYFSKKGGTKKISIHYWMQEEHKDEEKAEVLTASFTSVYNHKTSDPQGNQSPELVDRDREQTAFPRVPEEFVIDLLSHLETYV